MRAGIIGFILGAALVILALALVQQRVIRDVSVDLNYRFDAYVFNRPQFPPGDFVPGRMVHRLLAPDRCVITFYNAQYEEVKQADQPGRYGAVVRMYFGLGRNEVDRFITLYREPAKVLWGERQWPMSVQIPDDDLDPAVVRNQQTEIGEILRNSLVSDGYIVTDKGSPHLAILLAGLSETKATDPPAVQRTNVFARDADWWYGLRQRLGLEEKYPYMVDLPRDYDADPAKRWPLILYLHTDSESGTNFQSVRQSGLDYEIVHGRQVPAIVLSPQFPYYETWNPRILAKLLDEISAKYRVDPDRVYLSGGPETWNVALAFPERLAAISTIWCDTDVDDAARLKDVPVWAFDDDLGKENTPTSLVYELVDAIRQAGGHAHLTLADRNRDVWAQAYATDALYTWLLAQKRGQPEVITPGVPAETGLPSPGGPAP